MAKKTCMGETVSSRTETKARIPERSTRLHRRKTHGKLRMLQIRGTIRMRRKSRPNKTWNILNIRKPKGGSVVFTPGPQERRKKGLKRGDFARTSVDISSIHKESVKIIRVRRYSPYKTSTAKADQAQTWGRDKSIGRCRVDSLASRGIFGVDLTGILCILIPSYK
jgi:hypothetical protein